MRSIQAGEILTRYKAMSIAQGSTLQTLENGIRFADEFIQFCACEGEMEKVKSAEMLGSVLEELILGK